MLSALPAWFDFIGDYKLLVYGGLLFLMMRFAPGGMAAIAARVFRAGGATRNNAARATVKGGQQA